MKMDQTWPEGALKTRLIKGDSEISQCFTKSYTLLNLLLIQERQVPLQMCNAYSFNKETCSAGGLRHIHSNTEELAPGSLWIFKYLRKHIERYLLRWPRWLLKISSKYVISFKTCEVALVVRSARIVIPKRIRPRAEGCAPGPPQVSTATHTCCCCCSTRLDSISV